MSPWLGYLKSEAIIVGYLGLGMPTLGYNDRNVKEGPWLRVFEEIIFDTFFAWVELRTSR